LIGTVFTLSSTFCGIGAEISKFLRLRLSSPLVPAGGCRPGTFFILSITNSKILNILNIEKWR
jgi:hypothetical protein